MLYSEMYNRSHWVSDKRNATALNATIVVPLYNTAPPLTASPNTITDFQVQNMFFLVYIYYDSGLYHCFPIPSFNSQSRARQYLGGGGGVDSTSNIHYKAAKVMSGNDLMQHNSTELSFDYMGIT